MENIDKIATVVEKVNEIVHLNEQEFLEKSVELFQKLKENIHNFFVTEECCD